MFYTEQGHKFNFTESKERAQTLPNGMDGIITPNDLSLHFTVLDDSEHEYDIKAVEEKNFEHNYYLEIDVKSQFSLSTGEIPIRPGKTYRLSVTMKNHGADPVFFYSFWKKPKTLLRQYTFVGENGKPPSSKTQESFSEWKTFEETFDTRENEDVLMIRLLSHHGTFAISHIAIEEINP